MASVGYVADPFPLLVRPSRIRGNALAASEGAALAEQRCALTILEQRARAALRAPVSSFGPATERLFDVVSETEILVRVAPSGRLPRRFAARCLAEARRLRAGLEAEEAALRAVTRALARLDVAIRGSDEFPDREAIRVALGRRGIARLARLAASYRGEPEEGVRAGELALPGTGLLVDWRGRLRARDRIPASRIVLGPSLQSDAKRLAVRRGSLRAAADRARRRLASALAVVDAAWPEAGREIRARTRLVLPLSEPGLVSYSHMHRPGVSYVNLRGKSILDLADDLLHETAHHRLHAIEARTSLFPARHARRSEDETRYFSPWRRSMRPVRGIFHAAFTFSFRAELFRRILAAAKPARGRVGPLRVDARLAGWLRSEASRESRQVARAYRDLMDASRRGLLTASGRALLRNVRAAVRQAATARVVTETGTAQTRSLRTNGKPVRRGSSLRAGQDRTRSNVVGSRSSATLLGVVLSRSLRRRTWTVSRSPRSSRSTSTRDW